MKTFLKVTALSFMIAISSPLLADNENRIEEITLDDYMQRNGLYVSEGYCYRDAKQPGYLKDLVKNNDQIELIAEIGFNAGHSCELFLTCRENIFVYSFDIMHHNYSSAGKKYIDLKYPNRHFLIEGNSLQSIPQFYEKNKKIVFDLIFIDGDHSYTMAYNDIVNMQHFANKNTVLVIDDVNLDGVEKAYQECLKQGIITEGVRYNGVVTSWVECNYVFQK